MTNFEPGTYDLQSLLEKLSGEEEPSEEFGESITKWRDLKATQVDLGPTEENKFIRGIIHEQSAEKLRPFVEILSNSIDACIEFGVEKPKLELLIRVKLNGSYVIEISDKGIGSGMSSEVFVQKYLPPSASTKGQSWSSSIGQMGVGANQQYSLLMRDGDEILVTTTDETGHATLMGVRPKDDSLQATLAAGTVPQTKVQQGLDKQGTLTRITLSRETAQEIGFTPNNLLGYLADRFGSYQQADLSVRVVGRTKDVERVSKRDDYRRLTPDGEYARALQISVDRLKKSKNAIKNRTEVVYQLTQEVSDKTHFIHEADLAYDYLVQDEVEQSKTAVLQVSRERGDTSLVYLSVLGVRFGEPLVIQGNDIPATIDVNLDYRIGQISESRSQVRLTEFDYLRLAALIGSLEQREDIPLEVRLKITIALTGFCSDLDKQSPNKLRYDLNLTKALEQTISSLARSADKSKLWPGEFGSLTQDTTAIVIPPKVASEDVFAYEALGFRRVDTLQSDKGDIYTYPFPDNDRRPFLWTEQTLVINELLFPYLLSEDENLQKADMVKIFAIQDNLREAEMSSDTKMPMRISLKVGKSPNESLSPPDRPSSPFVTKKTESPSANSLRQAAEEIRKAITYAEQLWKSWSLEDKQKFVVQFIVIPDETPDDADVITVLGLTNQEEINAFIIIFIDYLEDKLSDYNLTKLERELNVYDGDINTKIKASLKVRLDELSKSSEARWTDVRYMYVSLNKSMLAKEMISNSPLFFDYFNKLDEDTINKVVQLENNSSRGLTASFYSEYEYLAKAILIAMAKDDTRLAQVKYEELSKLIDKFFETETGYDESELGRSYLSGRVEQMYDLFYFFINEGRGFDPIVLKILFSSCNQDINKLRAALWIAGEYNLSPEEIKETISRRQVRTEPSTSPEIKKTSISMDESLDESLIEIPPLASMFQDLEPLAGQEALAIFLDEKTQLMINDGMLSDEISSQSMSADQSVGEVVDPNSSDLALRRILHNVNSVEPGLGGSVHEAIKNAVQAINRARGHRIDVSSRVVISDFMEVGTAQDQGKYGFGFRLSDEAGWDNAEEALRVLTTPGKGEGLHSVHFLTLLKEYDVVRVRATDRQGKTALIEYRRVVDQHQQKVTDVRVSHNVIENNHQPGTIIEGVKWTEYPQADSSIFRTSIDHFARNVPIEEAEIFFDDGNPESELKNLNTSAETVLQPVDIPGFGTASIIRTSREWYNPEITIDHVPVSFDLTGMIRSIGKIPEPYQELLISSGFTLNIANPQIAIIRSTLEFKDQVAAQRVLRQYLSENWQELFTELVSRGKVDLARGGFLTGDSWYDSARFGQRSQRYYQRRLQQGFTGNWATLTDKTKVGTYLYFEPLIRIGGEIWSIAQIIEDQYKSWSERQLPANDIPLPILRQIRNGKERIQRDETQTANNTTEYVEAPPAIRQVIDNVHSVVQPCIEDTDDILVRTHTGSFRGFGNRAFHVGGTISFNLDTMTPAIERAGIGDLESLGIVISVDAHELEHGRRREDESPFSHTQEFYASVQKTILSIDSEQIASLV